MTLTSPQLTTPSAADPSGPSLTLVRRLALVSIIANIGIVVTGGAVRLTGSGLGCPTWPRCTSSSYVATAQMGAHGAIEFTNRLLTFAVGAIALAGLVAAWRLRDRRPDLRGPAALVLAYIPAQAIIGGITVWTNLNPWVVGLHFLASMAVIAVCHEFWRRTRRAAVATATAVPAALRQLAVVVTVISAATLVVGTWVTGSGPHAGDAKAHRTGWDPQMVSQAHADLVLLLVGLTVALWFALRAVGAPAATVRAALILLGVELGQGLIGFVQYFTGLPALLVGAHLLGAGLVWWATLHTLHSTRTSPA